MNALPPGDSSGTPEVATAEQTALLRYLGLLTDDAPLTALQAAALISRAEADPVRGARLAAWSHERSRLHPELFGPAKRSFREARWWQSRISDDGIYGYGFTQPSLNQTLVILEALDRQAPGWDEEPMARRECRFMNELATLSPELCRPGCAYPHALPEGEAANVEPAAPAASALPTFTRPSTLSAPFVPGLDRGAYTATSPSETSPAPAVPSQPAWNPSVQPPAPIRGEGRRKPSVSWRLPLILVAIVAAGAGGYYYLRSHAPALELTSTRNLPPATPSKPPAAPTPVPALESRKRAIVKYPELGRANSPFNTQFLAAYHRLEAEHNLLLQQPDWPERVADQCATATH